MRTVIFTAMWLVLAVPAAIAMSCDLSDRRLVEQSRISYDAFSELDRGAVAIGEGKCKRDTNICDHYVPITGCDTVRYAHPPGDTLNPLSIAFQNGSDICNDLVPCADTFLSAAMILPADPAYLPTIEVSRNISVRWQRTSGVDTRWGFDMVIRELSRRSAVLKLLTEPGAALRKLFDLNIRWHSAFIQHHSQVWVETWSFRDDVLSPRDFAACADGCSMKLFLIKFEEAVGKPAVSLRISGNMGRYREMELRTAAFAQDRPYDRSIKFSFVAP